MNCTDHGSFPGEGSCPVCSGAETVNPIKCSICGFKWTSEVQSHDHSKDTQKPPKRIRKDNGKRTRRVSVARMQLQAKTILAREMDRLMEVSYTALLNKDQGLALRSYIELLNELEELEKIKVLEKHPKEGK